MQRTQGAQPPPVAPPGRPLRVAIIAPGPQTEGGITTVVERVFDQLRTRPQISVRWIPSHRTGHATGKLLEAIRGLARACWYFPRTDVVHIHSSAQVSFYRKSVFFWLARLANCIVIWHLHAPNQDFEAFFDRGGMTRRYINAVFRRCAKIVVLSRSWLALVSRVVSTSRVCVIYNPIPDAGDEPRRTGRDDECRVLYLAHLIQRKGYPLLIRAFAAVAGGDPRCRLVFAGSGELEEARALARELDIEDKVEFLGWIGDEQRTDELRRATVFALPSYQEGLPMGVLEAMAYGLPVITTPVGGIPDVIEDGTNGILIEPGDEQALAAALRSVIADRGFREALGDAARDSVQLMNPADIAAQWQDLYLELSADRKAA